MKKLFTSESVSEGHPDKVCDIISDAILDECLKQDKYSRVACEVFATDNMIVVGGEISAKFKEHVDYEKIVRESIKNIGYNDIKNSISWDCLDIIVKINKQSIDIAQGLTNEDNLGAGDQGIMFGYACSETKNYMPLAISLANQLVYLATKLRKENKFKYAKPDMKSQVTIDYTNLKKPRIETILMSIQHSEDYNEHEFKKYIYENIMKPIALSYDLNIDFNILINPTGKFIIGGPKGDTGLTGRKIIADTYGGYSRHGGGAFSGKDATKVDRSAAYMCRYVAKNLVAAGLAEKLEIELAYAIGVPKPVSIFVETFNTNKIPNKKIVQAILENVDFSVSNIINTLNLRQPIYSKTSSYGHFGKDGLPWEQLNLVPIFKKYLNKEI